MFGWNRNPFEKRTFVKKGTEEPAEAFVTDDKGNVVGRAASEAEVKQIVTDSSQEFKEAA